MCETRNMKKLPSVDPRKQSYLVIPRDSKFAEFFFQTLAESTIVSSIVGSDTKQFVGNPIVAQDFQENIGHILASMVLTETFEADDLLMKHKIVVDPLTDNPYSVSGVIVCETGIEKNRRQGGDFPVSPLIISNPNLGDIPKNSMFPTFECHASKAKLILLSIASTRPLRFPFDNCASLVKCCTTDLSFGGSQLGKAIASNSCNFGFSA